VPSIDFRIQRHAFAALAAAALFGASTPLAKLLLGEMPPLLLAGLLYLGSGVGLGVVYFSRRFLRRVGGPPVEAPFTRSDLPWLAGAILAGGVAAPVALLWGLSGTPASSTSLLLTFEGVITAFVAAMAFHEQVGRRVWLAALVMLAGGMVLAYDPRASLGLSPHALAIVAACALWALDNNLTAKISGSDPVQIAATKGLVAGTVNVSLSLAAGTALPGASAIGGALIIGFAGYGVSLVLFILALRHLGSARTAAHFGTAPFLGAALAIPLLGEPVTAGLLVATALMSIATWLVLTEAHAHEHTHHSIRHAHRHVHDEHHRHAHDGSEGSEPHGHAHAHESTTHAHPHLPDLHHRHGHS
jgi:drug/metabolite transporter (DMT)-like permease